MEEWIMATTRRVGIVGGGPGGLMLARLLQLGGADVTVFERDAHAGERPQGGSLDLHAETGQRAMRLAGLEAEFVAAARPEDQGDRLYDADGTMLLDRDGAGDDRPEIDRTELRRILLGSLAPRTIQWGAKADAVKSADGEARIVIDGTAHAFDAVVGADGAWSRVRPLLTDARPAYQGVTLVELGFDAARHAHVGALVGGGKMFAVGDNRVLIAQRNGNGHIRGYAGLRMDEETSRTWAALPHDAVRLEALRAFADWEPRLKRLIVDGDLLAVRPLHALPIGLRWAPQVGVTLIGDAAHLMSPFSGEGVNLALADAVDLAEALMSADQDAVADFEDRMAVRAHEAAEGAAAGLESAFSREGATPVLEHYLDRAAA
jgi:2-polyprenyl-6-methoxyphenol hydroxylase-like FAD-dependent oxidoreductase